MSRREQSPGHPPPHPRLEAGRTGAARQLFPETRLIPGPRGRRGETKTPMADRFAAPLTAMLALILAGCTSPADMGPAPPFTLNSTEGGQFSLAEQRGQVVVVSFFATW